MLYKTKIQHICIQDQISLKIIRGTAAMNATPKPNSAANLAHSQARISFSELTMAEIFNRFAGVDSVVRRHLRLDVIEFKYFQPPLRAFTLEEWGVHCILMNFIHTHFAL